MISDKLNTEYAHNMHGKVECKIQHVKSAMSKHPLQWDTLGDQIANCVYDSIKTFYSGYGADGFVNIK